MPVVKRSWSAAAVPCTAGLIAVAAGATLPGCGAPASLAANGSAPDSAQNPTPGAPTESGLPTPSPSHTPTPMPTPATIVFHPGPVTLTDRDTGGVFQVRLGTTILVDLHWATAGDDVNGPASSLPAVIMRTRQETSSDHVAASFRSVGTGRAFLAAVADPACLRSASPCDQSSRSWRVIITVVP